MSLGGHDAFTARATAGQAGAVLVEIGGAAYRGTYTWRGGLLVLRVADDRGRRLLFTLQRAARKP